MPEAPIRPCIVLETFHPVVGGGEVQGKALADGLAALGLEPLVVTLRSRADLPPREKMCGYEVRRVGWGRNRWLGIPPVGRALKELSPRYDLIYVSGFRTLGLPALWAARKFHKKVVLEAQNNGEMSGAYFDPVLRTLGLRHDSIVIGTLNAWRKSRLRNADHFVAVASSIEREFLGEGVPARKITRIPYGVDLSRFRPSLEGERALLRKRLGLPGDATIVCFTGRLVAWKGPLTLLEAWRQTVGGQADGAGVHPLLIFLGSGGADRDNCEERARRYQCEHGLEGSVRFFGNVSNVPDYLRSADVFAFPTEDDSFGTVVLEAMASGLPVITTCVAGLADYVDAEVNALAVPPRDPGAVRQALLRLLHDRALRSRLGETAARAVRRFSIERVAACRFELIRELLCS